jgi:2-polyprenyl-3-methyl-5-hydroxy-6-metoxy-1,4-benzoquinol methylase
MKTTDVSEDYLFRYHRTNFPGSMPKIEDFMRVRARGFEWFEDNYAPLLPPDKQASILDIGCGIGGFLLFLKNHGYDNIEGVDIAGHMLEYCRQLVGCPATEITDLREFLGPRESRYDMIYLGDVIEHFPKDELLPNLAAIQRALRPGGFLLVRTNNAASLAGPYMRYTSLTHEFCFQDLVMKKVMETAGFKPVKIFGEHLGFRWRPKYIAWLLLRKVWFAVLKIGYLAEVGENSPRVLTRYLLAQAFKPATGEVSRS